MENDVRRIKLDTLTVLCITIVTFIFILIFAVFSNSNAAIASSASIDYSKLWSYENGSVVDMNNLKTDDVFWIHKRITVNEVDGTALCFYSKNILFTVYLDGEPLYSFNPNPPRLFGRAYGYYPHTVPLPVSKFDGEIVIKVENCYSGKAGFITDMVLADDHNFVISTLQRNIPEFLFCLVSFVFGIIVFFIGLTGRYYGEKRYEIISAGAFAIVCSVWIATETQILSVLTGSPFAVHFLDYMAMDFISFPALMFIAYLSSNKNSVIVVISGILTVLLVGFSIVSTMLDFKDYHQLIICSQVLIIISIIAVIYFIVSGLMQKKVRMTTVLFLFSPFILSIILAIWGIISYNRYNIKLGFPYLKIALFIFILDCGIYEFKSISDMSRRSQYAEIMEKIAYSDSLTGLLNRAAFNRETDAAAKKKTPYTFVMLDMNYLKLVNDRLGHAYGDEYLKSLAECIKNSFNHGEKCFRIGGDEFFIMSKESVGSQIFNRSINTLNRQVEDYNDDNNPDIPLSIAIGISEYNPEKDDIEDSIRLSDKNMYTDKTAVKKKLDPILLKSPV